MRTRDPSGRYDFDNMALICVCGHTLGEHYAAQPRPCGIGEGIEGPDYPPDVARCGCEKFRRSRKGVRIQDRNGVRVRVHEQDGGTTVEAECSCFGSPTRTHSRESCPVAVVARGAWE